MCTYNISFGLVANSIQCLQTLFLSFLPEKGKHLDTMTTYEYKPERRFRVLFLRVAYAMKPENQPSALHMSMPSVNYRNFYPALEAGRLPFEFETVADTVPRIEEWLRTAGK